MASGNDIANLSMAATFFGIILLVFIGIWVAIWVLEYLTRHLEGFLNAVALHGPGKNIIEMYHERVPAGKRVLPGDENFGSIVFNAIGTLTTSEGRSVRPSSTEALVDTVPVHVLVDIGRFIKHTAKEMGILEEAVDALEPANKRSNDHRQRQRL